MLATKIQTIISHHKHTRAWFLPLEFSNSEPVLGSLPKTHWSDHHPDLNS